MPDYRVVSVYDVSQTDGKELPDISVDNLVANVEQYEDFFKALEKASPVPIGFEKIDSGANGYFSLVDKRLPFRRAKANYKRLKRQSMKSPMRGCMM